MQAGIRIVRIVVGTIITAVMLLSAVGYVVYATNGILDEVAAQDKRDRYDTVIVGTATALAERLTAVSLGVYVSPTNDRAPVIDSATATAVPTATPIPATDTPVPTDIPTEMPTDVPTATYTALPEQVQVADTDTPVPTETATATLTPVPSITPIPTNTPRPTVTPIPTNTLRPSVTPVPSDTPVPTPTPTDTPTSTPTLTPTTPPTNTPTATFTATIAPTATYVIEGTYAIPYLTPIVPIPPAAPFIDTDPDVVNFLLLGSDTTGGGVGHTDVMIIVSVNKRAGSVAMWHIPRDVLVYIPNYTMERLNLAYALGEGNDYPGGGFGLMKETIRYNFGIEVDHYARVDFDGYMEIIGELGGLDISVDCAIADWRLITPDLDPTVEESWEYYTLPIGRQRLSPYMALWYARSRKTTNDLDRGRRQMDVLRAMWHQARAQGLFAQVTQLWPQAMEVVETDMELTDVLSLVPLAVNLDMSNIARYSGTQGVHYEAFVTPDDGREVVLPKRDALLPLIEDFLTPPTANRLGRQAITVDVIDASAYGVGFDEVAVDRLAWEGFTGRVVTMQIDQPRELTVIYDFTGQTKGSVLDELRRVLRVTEAQVVQQPDPNRTVDFRVEIGRAYNSCVYGNAEDEIEAGPPVPTPVITPAATVDGSNNVG